jgi:NitT/TauT family transport system permease protein
MAISSAPAGADRLDRELSGLDALELPVARRTTRAARLWAATWPKLMAVGTFFLTWQLIVWSGWKPEYVLPPPATVFDTLFSDFGDILDAVSTTMVRAVEGFTLAVVIGTLVGAVVSRNRILRAGIGSMITGLQTMPSIAWFPLAILLFKATNGAILFVVVLGAAPSIANGLIHGIDHIPPVYLRAGRVLGARGYQSFRHIVLPAALPSFVAGLKQGWAFAWRSLLAGELLVLIPGTFSLGYRLELERGLNNTEGVIAIMMVIFVIGVIVDGVFFGTIEKQIRRRYGLVDESTSA